MTLIKTCYYIPKNFIYIKVSLNSYVIHCFCPVLNLLGLCYALENETKYMF